jgi:hypothetical protein
MKAKTKRKLRVINNKIERRRLDIISLQDEIDDLHDERDELLRKDSNGQR